MARKRWYRKKVEKILGRKLRPDEIVHHKDHNPENSDSSNLEVLTKEEHNILHFKGKNALYRQRRKKDEAKLVLDKGFRIMRQ